MKNIVFLMFSTAVLLTSCREQKYNIEKLNKIQDCNVQLFKGVRIQPRELKNGIYRVPFFTKEIKGKLYLLPNYSYYGCHLNNYECLKKSTNRKFDIFEFAGANDIKEKNAAIEYTGKCIQKILLEYENIGIYEVLSDSKIGDCVIFYLDKNHYVAYVQDTSKIHNMYWKSIFVPEYEIAKFWYSNIKFN